MNVRLEKLRADPQRDARLLAEWSQVATPYHRAARERQGSTHGDPKMTEYRWMLEEMRVSLYAQELRTPMPISVKRLQKVWEVMQRYGGSIAKNMPSYACNTDTLTKY